MVYVVLPMRRMRTRCEEYMHPMYDDISNVSPYIYICIMFVSMLCRDKVVYKSPPAVTYMRPGAGLYYRRKFRSQTSDNMER